MKITMIGSGYVGLTTGACLAEVGHQVLCIDSDESKIAILKAGGCPIFEPGLEAVLKKNIAARRLQFGSDIAEGVRHGEVLFIAVATPQQENGSVDLCFVERVAREIAEHLDSYRVVVDKSTVPVKTGERVAQTIRRYARPGVDFDVVSNPEFLREGSAVEDLLRPDRIVIGANSDRAIALMQKIYEPFSAPVLVTDIHSAELIKHAANSFLALKISYANALSVVCEAAGANVLEVVRGMGLDERIGTRFLNAGLGFGGSCFPKDLSAFIHISSQLGYDFRLLKEVQQINSDQMERFIKKITDTLWVIRDKRIGVLGLAFKQNTDDVRLSPAIDLCQRLLKEGARLRVHDPKAMEKAKAVLPPGEQVEYVGDRDAVPEGCDALVIATEWPEFAQLDLTRARKSMTTPIVVDGRNLLDPVEMEKHGFIYKSIGR